MPSRTAIEVRVGVDVHKARHTLVGLDRDGREVVVEEVATDRAALAALAAFVVLIFALRIQEARSTVDWFVERVVRRLLAKLGRREEKKA